MPESPIRRKLIRAAAGLLIAGVAAPAILLLHGWWQYHRLEKSIVEKMDQYYLDITVPGREEYLLEGDEIFEVPYMASKLSAAPVPTRIYDSQDRVIGEYLAEKGIYVRDPDEIPLLMKRALVATEDREFYNHHGINYRSLARAVLMNLKSLHRVQGGSTLTQQLAKILFTARQKTFGRKIFEMFIARKLETKFTKDQILLMYLNFVYLGHGCYGIESASRFYFDKPASALTLGESALLAGIISSPDHYSPFNKPELAHARLRTVLKRMAKNGFIPESETARYEEEFWGTMQARLKNPEISFWRMTVNKAPPFIEFVRRSLVKAYSKERIMKGGLKVYTTLDLDVQNAATAALQQSLRNLNAESSGTAKMPIEASFAAVRPSDGAILAMVGGSAFNFKNQLNRAVDIARPIGSSVKPFIYALAFLKGRKPDDTIMDEPVHYKLAHGRTWSPHNYGGEYMGQVTLRVALKKSLNSVAVKLLAEVGVAPVVSLLSDAMGIPKKSVPANLSLALGTVGSSPLRLAAAYSIFVNGGHPVTPYFIRRIEDRDGKFLQEMTPAAEPAKQILDPAAAMTTLDVMRGVLEEGGTAYPAARSIGFNIPAAGKTGTTNDYKDAWFAGVTADLSAAVWTGYDDMRLSLGRGKSGGHVAAPVWLRCVKEIYRYRPTREFDIKPAGEVKSPS